MTIPRLDGPTVRPSPEPSRLPPLESYGVDQRGVQGVARGLAAVSETVDRVRLQFDETRVEEAEAQFRATLDRLWSDPKDGLLAKQGTDAIAATDQFRDRLTSAIRDTEGRLTTERQKVLFRARAERLRQDTDAKVNAYAMQADRQVRAKAYEANMVGLMDEVVAAATRGDGTAVTAAVRQLSEKEALYRDHLGEPDTAIAQARAEVVSRARLAQLTAMANAKMPSATLRETLVQVGSDLTPADRASAMRVVDVAVRAQDAQGWEDRAMAAYPTDEAQALAFARTARSEIRDEVVQRVTARFAEQRRIERQATNDRFDAAKQAVDQAGGNLAAVPADLMAHLEADGGVTALRVYAKSVREAYEPEQDWDWWAAFVRKPAQEIADMNLIRDVRPYVDDRHFEQALAMQAEVRGGGASRRTGADLTPRSFADMLDNTLAGSGALYPFMGKDRKDWSDEDRAAYALVERAAWDAVEALEAEAGGRKAVSPSMRQQAIDRVLLQSVTVPRFLGSRTVPVLTITPEDAAKVTYTGDLAAIPASDWTQLAAYMQSLGITRGLTDEEKRRVLGFVDLAFARGFSAEDKRAGILRILGQPATFQSPGNR